MLRKLLLSMIVLSSLSQNVPAQTNRQVEVFDIAKEKVIQQSAVTPDIQVEAKKMLKSITMVYTKLNPIPAKGFMIKIPLEPPFTFKQDLFNGTVDEVIFIFPENENPYLLIFNSGNTTCFFHFSADTEDLLKKLHFIR